VIGECVVLVLNANVVLAVSLIVIHELLVIVVRGRNGGKRDA
jgi:hypothetical protein